MVTKVIGGLKSSRVLHLRLPEKLAPSPIGYHCNFWGVQLPRFDDRRSDVDPNFVVCVCVR